MSQQSLSLPSFNFWMWWWEESIMNPKWKWSCSCLHSFINTPLCVYISGSSDLLTAPGQGCPTPGCNGVGHIRGPRYGTHYTLVAYTPFLQSLCRLFFSYSVSYPPFSFHMTYSFIFTLDVC